MASVPFSSSERNPRHFHFASTKVVVKYSVAYPKPAIVKEIGYGNARLSTQRNGVTWQTAPKTISPLETIFQNQLISTHEGDIE